MSTTVLIAYLSAGVLFSIIAALELRTFGVFDDVNKPYNKYEESLYYDGNDPLLWAAIATLSVIAWPIMVVVLILWVICTKRRRRC